MEILKTKTLQAIRNSEYPKVSVMLLVFILSPYFNRPQVQELGLQLLLYEMGSFYGERESTFVLT